MIPKTRVLAGAAAAMALCIAGTARQASLSEQDRSFIQELAQGNRVEVQLGRIAVQRATNPEVKEFAQRMIDDHSKLQSRLETFAAGRNMRLPSSTTAEQQNLVSRLQGLSGSEFDRQYITTMLEEHRNDVAKVQQHMTATQDPAVQELARDTLPILENHIRIAENVAGRMGIPAGPGLNEPVRP
jgi:putative membrane protein